MKFAELNEEQKEKALELYRHINVDFDEWDECLSTPFSEEMQKYGFDEIEIRSDVSFCQGSGASFTCDRIDLIKYLTKTRQLTKYKKLRKLIEDGEMTGKIESICNRYNHSNTVDSNLIVSYYTDITDVQDQLVGELQQDIIDLVRRECNEYHRNLENFYQEETSDARVEEHILLNGYEFEEKDTSVNYL